MARCRCAEGSCGCVIHPGPNTTVTGTGSSRDPYVISSTTAATALDVADTATVDLSLTGLGTVASPWLLTAEMTQAGALIGFTDTTDIDMEVTGTGSQADPLSISASIPLIELTGGVSGDVLTNDGTGVYRPVAPAAGGGIASVVVDFGITGDGTAAYPLRIDICTYDQLKAACAP